MRITAELSLYPLEDREPIAQILELIDALRRDPRLDVVVNQMSTQLTGELEDVMAALTFAMQHSFAADGTRVLVAKFLSKALPISEPPVLDPKV